MSGAFLFLAICYLAYIWSLCIFCETCLGKSKINKKVLTAGLFAAGFLSALLAEQMNVSYIVMALTKHALFTALVLLLYQADFYQKLLASAALITLNTMVWNFGGSLFSILLLAAFHRGASGEQTVLSLEEGYVASAAGHILTILVILWLTKKVRDVFENKVRSWYLMLALSLLFLVGIVDLVNWGGSNGVVVVSDGSGADYWNLYYNQLLSYLSICLVTALTMCIAAGLFFGMHRIFAEQRQKERYQSQMAYYQMISEQYRQMERLRHDMKNHVLSLYGLWNGRDYEKIGRYLQKMLESGEIETGDEATGNRAVDALLYHKRNLAKQYHIAWESDVQLSARFWMEEFDLCVLFGNVLDNAINACREMNEKEKRFVHVEARRIKNCFLLTVRNGTKLEDKDEIKPGIGLLGITETASKYQGTMEMKSEGHVFEITILIPGPGDVCEQPGAE